MNDAAPARHIAPPDFLGDPALRRVLAALPGARLVGGCVRDALAGRAVADIDIATPMAPEAVASALAAAGLKSVPTGLAHGTLTAIADGHAFEVTTLRRDVATDGRHAVVAFTADWREDAARRDFTINAMSMSPEGAVFDYFGGLDDLAAGRVRFVGDPATRIAEDYLRALRFFRFFARYAAGAPNAAPDAAAVGAVERAARGGGLALLSAERVWAELKRILAAETPDKAVSLMRRLGVWAAIMPPESPDPAPRSEAELDTLPPDPILRLAALDPPAGIAEHLKMSAAERERLCLLRGPPPPEDPDDATLRRLLADTPPHILIGRAWLARRPAALRARIAASPVPVFPLQGRDLLEAGLSPGPAMGALLRDLRAWWLAGGCVATEGELGAELARRLGR